MLTIIDNIYFGSCMTLKRPFLNTAFILTDRGRSSKAIAIFGCHLIVIFGNDPRWITMNYHLMRTSVRGVPLETPQ